MCNIRVYKYKIKNTKHTESARDLLPKISNCIIAARCKSHSAKLKLIHTKLTEFNDEWIYIVSKSESEPIKRTMNFDMNEKHNAQSKENIYTTIYIYVCNTHRHIHI